MQQGSPLPAAQSACGSAGCLAKISLATNPVFCLSESELPSVWDHQSRGVRIQNSALRELGNAVSVWGRAWVLPSIPSLCLVAAVGSEASRVVCVCLFVLKKSWNPRGSAVLSVIWNPKCAALLQLREFPCPVRSRGGWEGARGCWISGFHAGMHAIGHVDFFPDLFSCQPCTALTPTSCVHTRPSKTQVLKVALRKTQQKSEALPSAQRARGGQSS